MSEIFSEKPLISAVIPVYNGERFLAEALESVLSQDYPSVEVLAIDDGSTDGTAAICKRFAGLRYIWQTNQGLAAARNRGIREASGEFAAVLDADDLWVSDKLSLQMDYLLRHPELDFVLSRIKNFLEPGVPEPPWWRDEELQNRAFSVTTLLARKTALDRLGYFDESYRHAEDMEWLLRVKEKGARYFLMPEILLHRHIHSEHMSQDIEKNRRYAFEILKTAIERKRNGPFEI